MRPHFITSLLTATFVAVPAAFAACPGEVLLACDTSKTRALAVCLQGETFHYRYGLKGKPDMALSVEASSGPVEPWPGIGHNMWSDLIFTNGAVSYSVWTNFERKADGRQSAGVTVREGDKTLATITCQATDPQKQLVLFEDVMGELGYCNTPGQRDWKRCR